MKRLILILLILIFLGGCEYAHIDGVSVGAIRVDSPYGDEYAPIGLVNIKFGDK